MDTKTKILIGLAVTFVIAGSGVAAFFLFRQNKVNKPLGTAGYSPAQTGSGASQQNGVNSTSDTAVQQAYDIATYGTTGEVPSNWSQVETGFDGEYNYQKRAGIWWTAKKSNPTNWVSLADPQWASAVQKLNAAYPND